MYRLIATFTEPGEVVLDCFNGSGTTTLAADLLGRRYVGIELAAKYVALAQQRHAELAGGLDPFGKRAATGQKNNGIRRLGQSQYEVSKKCLQLDVKRIADALGHVPSRAEVAALSPYPSRFFDEYFSSWGEVTAAARHGGMSERRGDGEAA